MYSVEIGGDCRESLPKSRSLIYLCIVHTHMQLLDPQFEIEYYIHLRNYSLEVMSK